MKNSNMTKKLVDRLAFGGLFALYVILIYMLIYKLIYKQPTLRSLAIVVVSVIVTVVIFTIGIIVVIKKYGPYRAEDETPLPFIPYFAAAIIGQYLIRMVLNEANIIAETATDISVGIIKIVALLTVLFVAIIISAKTMEFITFKYNNRKKDNQQK